MINVYLKGLALIALLLIVYRGVVPVLVSMPDTVAVLSGFTLAAVTPAFAFIIFKRMFIKKGK
ncbi:hypothetical protein CBW54_03055 [Yersinia kristensenii]|nr:hypothetical protein CBW54_03055 [Yersinia kristensenii]